MSKTYSELTKLLKILRSNGVSEYESDTIKIRMRYPTTGDFISPSKAKPRASSKATKIESEELARAEVDQKADELAMLIIENPSLYEELLASGELEDGSEKIKDA